MLYSLWIYSIFTSFTRTKQWIYLCTITWQQDMHQTKRKPKQNECENCGKEKDGLIFHIGLNKQTHTHTHTQNTEKQSHKIHIFFFLLYYDCLHHSREITDAFFFHAVYASFSVNGFLPLYCSLFFPAAVESMLALFVRNFCTLRTK